jgi:hypothetical protein
LEHILQGGNGQAASHLLQEFGDGYPLDRLHLLLESESEEAVAAGAFIAAELGVGGAPLLTEAARLLERTFATVSRRRWVQSDVVDVIVVNATPEHGALIARAVRLIEDVDEAARWTALNFLVNASKDQLGAALPYLANTSIARYLAWLLDSEDTPGRDQDILAKLGDADPLTRRFAAAAAARLSQHDVVLLQRAADSSDVDVRSFAEHKLGVIRRVQEVRRRQTTEQRHDRRDPRMGTDSTTEPGDNL